MNSTHALFYISAREIGGKLKPHGSVCLPFWKLTVEWSGPPSCLFWRSHRFHIASFSPSTLENSVFKKHRFQMLHSGERFRMAAFSVIVFDVVVWTIALIRSKTTPFSFENGLVWTGPNMDSYPVAHPTFFLDLRSLMYSSDFQVMFY